LSRHVAEVNAELRKQNPDLSESDSAPEINGQDEEWEGIEEGEPEVAQDEEYVDEEKYTTVTVEPMKDPREESEDDAGPKTTPHEGKTANGGSKAPKKRIWNKEDKAKSKKKTFRYESKAERSVTRQKQKSKNHAAKIRRKGK
jgi:ribosomal RNA-processing protein 17